ncbi:MAG: methyltransferase domain-containing protein [Minisyncoccia bacterium]
MNFTDPRTHIDALGLNPGDVVVDVGAGSGAYALVAAEAVTPRGTVYAVDLNRDLLTRLKGDAQEKGFGNIEIIWGDIEIKNGIKLSDHIADAILLCNTLFMVEDKNGLVAEIKRVLKPKGKVLVVEWSDSHGGIGPHKDHVFAEEAAKELFTTYGFSISHISDDASYHYRFVATHTL